jgi:hypothetical protein
MATKQELEEQVALLQKQLADQTPPDVTLLNAEIENLKIENELLKASVVDKDTARDAQLAAAALQVDELTRQLVEAGKRIEASAKVGKQEGVVLSGVKYDIVRQDRAADLVIAHRARFVEDDELCLVVKKS